MGNSCCAKRDSIRGMDKNFKRGIMPNDITVGIGGGPLGVCDYDLPSKDKLTGESDEQLATYHRIQGRNNPTEMLEQLQLLWSRK